MKIIKLSIERPITILMLFLLIILTGIISLTRLPVEFLPDFGYPQLTIITNYANSSPEEVETLITQPIEEVVSTLKGVRKVSSISRSDVSVITLKYNWGSDMAYASLSLREKLDNIRFLLPDEAERPNIAKLDPSEEPIMYITLSSKNSDEISEIQQLAENLIKRRLQQLEGVAAADVIGNLEEEIEIVLNEDKIKTLGLSLSEISSSIANSNYNILGGTIRDGHYRFNLKIVGEYQTLQDIGLTPVYYGRDGSIFTLNDIAEINSTYKDEKSITRLSGKRSLGILIRKEAGTNTVKVCNTVRKSLETLKDRHEEINFKIVVDQSEFIRESILSVLEAIILGGLLAFLVLFLFLSDLKSPFQIAIVIPISILAAFILMYFNHISLNIISLSGLALGVGMLVDNSIVVSENIYRHYQSCGNWKKAAYDGAKEVGMAITASTLTTLAVFIPILYVKGIAASMFKQQALTVTYSLLSSLLVAITLLPLLASLRDRRKRDRIKVKKSHGKIVRILITIFAIIFFPFKMIYRFFKLIMITINSFIKKFALNLMSRFQKVFDKFSESYRKLLEKSLRYKFRTILIFVIILILSFLILKNIDKEFFPRFEQAQFTLNLKLPPGTPLEKSDEVVSLIEAKIKKDSRIESYFTSIGKSTEDMLSYYLEESSSENLAEIKVNLKKGESSFEIIEDFRHILSDIPGSINFKYGDNILLSYLDFEESGLSIIVSGDELESIAQSAQIILDRIKKDDRFFNIKTDFETRSPIISLQVNRENAALYNIPIDKIATQIKANIVGDKVSEFRDFDDKIDITLTLDKDLNLEQLLDQVIIWNNQSIPLRVLVSSEKASSWEEIKRMNQNRQFTITSAYNCKMETAVKTLEHYITEDYDIASGNRIEISGVNKEVNNSLKSMLYALLFAIVLVYMILASQFESLKLPFIIMFVAPMGIIGVAIALYITGTSLSVMSTLGMVILAGIIVNDAILLVDYTNKLKKSGKGIEEAVKEAASIRLRPILMTTFTTVLGLLPLALGIGSGAELQSAMAVAVIGGMLSATFLTLILIPVLYTIFEK